MKRERQNFGTQNEDRNLRINKRRNWIEHQPMHDLWCVAKVTKAMQDYSAKPEVIEKCRITMLKYKVSQRPQVREKIRNSALNRDRSRVRVQDDRVGGVHLAVSRTLQSARDYIPGRAFLRTQSRLRHPDSTEVLRVNNGSRTEAESARSSGRSSASKATCSPHLVRKRRTDDVACSLKGNRTKWSGAPSLRQTPRHHVAGSNRCLSPTP